MVRIRLHVVSYSFSYLDQCQVTLGKGGRGDVRKIEFGEIGNWIGAVLDRDFNEADHLRTHLKTYSGETQNKCNQIKNWIGAVLN